LAWIFEVLPSRSWGEHCTSGTAGISWLMPLSMSSSENLGVADALEIVMKAPLLASSLFCAHEYVLL